MLINFKYKFQIFKLPILKVVVKTIFYNNNLVLRELLRIVLIEVGKNEMTELSLIP